MKKLYKRFILVSLSILLATGIFAKTGLRIYYTSGLIVDVSSEGVDHIEFYEENDEEEPGEPGGDEGQETEKPVLTSVDGYDLTYDEQGRLISFEDRYEKVTINYSNMTIEIIDDDGELETGTFMLNESGLVKSISFYYSWGSFYQEQVVELDYDSNGNLIKMTSSIIGKEAGEYEYEESYLANCVWNNGNLTQATVNYKAVEDGVTDYDDTYEYVITYSENANKFKQMPFIISDDVLDLEGPFGIFAVVGMVGNGPANLPSQIEETDDDGRTNVKTVSYTLNDNGSISTETFRNNTINYYYENGTRSAGQETLSGTHVKSRISKFAGKHRHRK